MSKNGIVIKDDFEITTPSKMQEMSAILKDHIVKQGLYTSIHGKNYVHVEGWQFAGGMLGIFPRVSEVLDLSSDKEIKWRATVELIDKSDRVVSIGVAICSNKEGKKKTFDEYAVLSMAQTRAIGKAYRNVIGWVMKLAGYESTPQEEMVEEPETKKKKDEPVKKTSAKSINEKLDKRSEEEKPEPAKAPKPLKDKISDDPKYKKPKKK